MVPKSQYLFATCQVGAENSLKEELNRRPENLRFAFSRPGFVTFKLPAATPIDGHALAYLPVFARVWGHSIGHVKSKEGDRTKLLQESAQLIAEHAPEKKLQLHVWPRQTPSPEGEPVADTGNKTSTDPMLVIANGLRKQLARQSFEFAEPTSRSRTWVADVVLVESNEWWIGLHQARLGMGQLPGGTFPVREPRHAPSRCWQQLEEALVCSQMPVVAGQVALEIGSAPGGMTMALLARGVNVVGADRAEMGAHIDNYVAAHPQTHFRHVPRSVFYLEERHLPRRTDWLIVDINAAPEVTLDAVEFLLSLMHDPPRGFILSFKLGGPETASDLPRTIARAESMGMPGALCRQLPGNRQEVTLTWHSKLADLGRKT